MQTITNMCPQTTIRASQITSPKLSRPPAEPFELVYLTDNEVDSRVLFKRCFWDDCNLMGIKIPQTILTEILDTGLSLQFGEHASSQRFFDFRNLPLNANHQLDGLVVRVKLKQLRCDASVCLKVQLTPVLDKQATRLSEKSSEYSILQWLRLLVHDYNNVNHISGGYLKYALDEANPNSQLADDIRGAIDSLQRNSDLTGELSEFTNKQLDSYPTFTQLNSLVYRLIESTNCSTYINNIRTTDHEQSMFLNGNQEAIEASLLTLAAEAVATTITSSIESVVEDYSSDNPELLAGEYLALNIITPTRNEPSSFAATTMEIAWAKKIVRSLGGDVISGSVSVYKIFLPLYAPSVELHRLRPICNA